MRCCLGVLLLAWWLSTVCAQAQPSRTHKPSTPRDSSLVGDTVSSSFQEKQERMLDLLALQLPKVQAMADEVAAQEAALKALSRLLAVPRNLDAHKDSALKVIVYARKFTDNALRQLKDLDFQWQPYALDLMAVYTRYGELASKKKLEPSLRLFLTRYRDYNRLMDKTLLLLQDLYANSEFLLNSKLN